MAKVGISKPYFAVYSESSGTVSYSSGKLLGKAVQVDLALDAASDNVLYADNAPAESDTQFAGGTLTVTTDDLIAGDMVTYLGVDSEAIGSSSTDKWYVFNDEQVVPYCGFGGIIKKIKNGVTYYVAFALAKIQFNNPALAVTTQGQTIDWQTTELTAKILRSDDSTHEWYRISSDLTTEAAAEAAVKAYLDIT